MRQSKRTALVTGSGRNIGRAIALHLGRAGFNVVINGSRQRAACDAVLEEIRSGGGTGLVVMGNVGNRAAAVHVGEAAIEAFGGVDVLVNNAAVRPSGGFLSVSEEEWNRVIDVNFNAAVWLARACLPGMVDRRWGRIVHFTGMNAQQGHAGKCHVSVAKHAAWGLTKSLAKEFGPKGITVNIISPGTIVGESAETHSVADQLDALRKRNPAGRLGTPDDIAAMVDLLVSDGGSFINGQLLQINGGVVT